MSEETQGQVPETSGGESAQDATTPKTFDESYVKKLREEAAGWRTKAQEAAAKISDFEKAQMTEAERLKAEAQEAKAQAEAAKAQAKQALAQAEIAKHAAKAGLDPTLAQRLVDVQFDDAGQPTGVDEAINNLLQQYPMLKAGSFEAGATNPGRQNRLTLDDIKKMSPDEINRRWDEVQKTMAGSN